MIEQWLRLIYLKGVSLNQKRHLVEHLGSAEQVLKLSNKDIKHLLIDSGVGNSSRINLGYRRDKATDIAVEQSLRCLQQLEAGFINITTEQYPSQLRQIYNAPLGLFYRGDPSLLNRSQIAIVGSRQATRSGISNAHCFAVGLTSAGVLVTSGLAKGIDSAAHRGALDINGNTTAVMATGIDQVYPRKNDALYQQIVEQGLVISEFPPGTQPRPEYFPQRNRIISGLSLGTLVVEAGLRSGSLITARLAAEQGREVFAVPGSINATSSKGCHYLLRQGAGLVENVEDIVQELNIPGSVDRSMPMAPTRLPADLAADPMVESVFSLIDQVPCPMDQLITISGLTADQVSSILIRLELLGLVSESAGGYQRCPR
jgi:DNA processing protein